MELNENLELKLQLHLSTTFFSNLLFCEKVSQNSKSTCLELVYTHWKLIFFSILIIYSRASSYNVKYVNSMLALEINVAELFQST